MELRGLFQYLVNQLKKGNGIELVLLQVFLIQIILIITYLVQYVSYLKLECLIQELIQQMENVQYTENMTEEQLDSMAGGETLRYQATSFGVTRNNKVLLLVISIFYQLPI